LISGHSPQMENRSINRELTLWSHDLKLARARKHFEELSAEVDRWVKGDGYAIRVEPHPEPPRYLVSVKFLRDPDADGTISLLLSDALQNARAALEYIAFALGEAGAREQFGRDMTERESENSGFPIIGDRDRDGFSGRGPDMFRAQADSKLSSVVPEARAVIEELQPFQQAPYWDYEGLWWLQVLARIDRHRRLHLAAVRRGDLRLDPKRIRNVKLKGDIDAFSGTLYPEIEDEAELGTLEAYPANPQEEMHLAFRDALTLAIDPEEDVDPIELPIKDWGITDVLNACITPVAGVLRTLDPFLPK
jgi:hypothetical protein